MRRETNAERAAWTAYVDGGEVPATSKYCNTHVAAGGRRYDSKYEAAIAVKLDALERAGHIRDLQYQVPLVLVEGKGKIRPIKYIADFTYLDGEGNKHWLDAKGMKLPLYRLKRKLAALLHGITVEEV